MTPHRYEIFKQRVFDELKDVPQGDRETVADDFIKAGARVGVDVVAEVVDLQRPAAQVLAEVREKSDAFEKQRDQDLNSA